jgi:hypothetical protein
MESFFFLPQPADARAFDAAKRGGEVGLERVLDGLQSYEVGPAQWSRQPDWQSADDPFANALLKQAKAGVNGCGVATLRGAVPVIWRISFDQGGRDCVESIAGCVGLGLLSHHVCPARGILNIPRIRRNPRDFKGEALGQLFVVETSKALVLSNDPQLIAGLYLYQAPCPAGPRRHRARLLPAPVVDMADPVHTSDRAIRRAALGRQILPFHV